MKKHAASSCELGHWSLTPAMSKQKNNCPLFMRWWLFALSHNRYRLWCWRNRSLEHDHNNNAATWPCSTSSDSLISLFTGIMNREERSMSSILVSLPFTWYLFTLLYSDIRIIRTSTRMTLVKVNKTKGNRAVKWKLCRCMWWWFSNYVW